MTDRSLAAAAAALFLLFASVAEAAPDYNGMLRRFHELRLAGKFDEALAEAQRFEAAVRPAFGVSHQNYAIALNHIGIAYMGKSRFKDAESYYRRALAIFEKT